MLLQSFVAQGQHGPLMGKGIKDTEKELCENDAKRRKKFNKEWKNILIN